MFTRLDSGMPTHRISSLREGRNGEGSGDWRGPGKGLVGPFSQIYRFSRPHLPLIYGCLCRFIFTKLLLYNELLESG